MISTRKKDLHSPGRNADRRLRRRLKQYEHDRALDSSARDYQLLIPEKSYTPTFIDSNAPFPAGVPTNLLVENELPPTPLPPPPSLPAPTRHPPLPMLLIAAGVAIVGFFLVVHQWPSSVSAGGKSDTFQSPTAPATTPLPPGGDEVRILCGRQPGLYVDRYGQNWDGDRYSKGGEAVQVQAAVISGGFDRNVFRGMRA